MESQGEAPKTTNVQVAVRCRPVNGEERRTAQATAIACDSAKKEVTVSSGPAGKKTSKTFTFDKVFGMYSTQEEVFETMVRPMVDEALAGFNTTIFAYGQTGTGKTHTMEGDINSEVDAGIVPRSVKAILETLEASGSEFTIRVSFLELYNEELQDLLVPPSSSSSSAPEKKLKLCEDVKKGVVCQNLEEVTVMGKDDIFEILQRGIKQRATAATLCNKNSSRSHSIFTMKIMIKECSVDGEEVVRHGQLNLVDLAGSECVGRSGAKNDRAKEAGSINQSLLTLGRVITALVDHHGHIPYRDSKLTRLLQESLGGKAKTCIIATLSPAAMAVEESMSTLDYAHRAKNIKNAPQLNQRMTKKVVLKEYCQEIETLRQQLQLTREKNGVYVDPNEYYAMEARIASQETQLLDCESALRMRNDEVKVLRADKDELGSQLGEAQKALTSTTAQLQSAESTLHVAQTELQHAQVEIAAHEAVIGEQTTTESTLTRVGGELQSEVSLRRGERDALLGKVDRLVACEAERLASASRFVGDVAASKRQLLGGVSSLLASNQQQSSELCDGVMQMLNKGKDTCATLTSAIDSALCVLIQDAEVAKDGMTASCGELQQHLRGTNASLAQSLQGMRQALSQWLGEVDSGIKAAVDQLAEQQRHVDATSEAVARQADNLTALAESFVAEQQAAGAQAVEATRAFQQDLAERLERHQETVAASTERARESVALKAAAMEKVRVRSVAKTLRSYIPATNSLPLSLPLPLPPNPPTRRDRPCSRFCRTWSATPRRTSRRWLLPRRSCAATPASLATRMPLPPARSKRPRLTLPTPTPTRSAARPLQAAPLRAKPPSRRPSPARPPSPDSASSALQSRASAPSSTTPFRQSAPKQRRPSRPAAAACSAPPRLPAPFWCRCGRRPRA